jgi:cobalt/nickel transport system permease protein
MAHVHLEDGALSIEWLVLWNLAAAALIGLAIYAFGRTKPSTRRLAIAAMCIAVGFAVFQIEIPVFGGLHVNLTPFMGIIVGPILGTMCVFVINVFSAAVGHGGWGMIGTNTIVNAVEVVIGYYLYRFLRVRLSRGRFSSAFGATSVALAVSAVLVVLIVAVSGIQGSNLSREETLANLIVIAVADVVTGIAEGVLTGYIVSFIGRIRPDLLGDTEEGSKVSRPRTTETSPDV